MGGGTFTKSAFATYSCSVGKVYDVETNTISNQVYKAVKLDESLNPKNVIRECANSTEHPNTVPVILALDVTGSMGRACQKTAEALGNIVTGLYDKYDDIEFMVMGIGDLAFDDAPIQASQFESDVRIAEALDKVYMEHGGGPNAYESYTAAWYFGLHHTKLDAFDKQGRKGIIITMGDEPLNPYLPAGKLKYFVGDSQLSKDVETKDLYKDVIKKFDVYHIAIDDPSSAYKHYVKKIDETFGEYLGDNLKVSTVNQLPQAIDDCISKTIESYDKPDTVKFRMDEIKEESTGETTGMPTISW